ncbi:hypothetical protein [Mucilaginibacter sp.]|uniref:hypothetical protein n=1 Tax=Mucilaginibacter sp. TaxID=1882438 RepID=UPI003D1005D9
MSFIGKLVYKLYFEKKSKQATIKKFGGKQNYLNMLAAEQEMKAYALNKLTIKSDFTPDGKFKLNFLTGDKFIHQSLFCTYSFFRHLSADEAKTFSVNYYSDGSLSDATSAILKTRFPKIKVISFEESMAAVNAVLSTAAFPYLTKKIETLPLFKKMIFPHLSNKGPAIFFDSDMLFIHKPTAFLNWLNEHGDIADHTLCIQDVQRSYGYTDAEILKIWPVPIKNDVNSGMYAMHSEKMDLPFIENMIKEFDTQLGTQYYMEQLITGILLEKSGNLFVAPPSDYIVSPTTEQIIKQEGVLHHYVNESKEFYFKESWKQQLT